MKVVVSSPYRYWSFRLAGQLNKKDALVCLYTQENRRKSDRIPAGKVKGLLSLRLLKIIELATYFLPYFGRYREQLIAYKTARHDAWVAAQLAKIKPDIFVGFSSSSSRSIAEARKLGIKTILECGSTHPLFQKEIVLEEYESSLGSRPDKFSNECIRKILQEFKHADRIMIPSSFVLRTFIKNGIDQSKVAVIPYGYDPDQFYNIGKNDDVFRVIWCGSICIRKGIHYLLRAFYELDLPGAELMLLGDIDPQMETFIRRYKRDNIRFIGPKKQDELFRFYSQGSVFVHPSVEEGLSLVLLEAMACSLPVICTTNTGGEDIITDGVEGFVIPIRDVAALKEKIRYMHQNQNRCQEMGRLAAEKIKSYTWDRYGDRIYDLYSSLLASQAETVIPHRKPKTKPLKKLKG